MFDSITAPRMKLRRGTSTAVSLALHGAAVAAAVAITYARAHMPRHEEPVAVTFRPPPPPPPPPPPAGHKAKTPRPKPVTPKVPPPAAIIQPKEPPKEEKPPEAPEVEEEEGEETGEEGGVIGGVVGGVVGGVGTTVAPVSAPRLEVDDATVHLTKLSGPAIEYTEHALEREVQGLMIVKCVVTVDGLVFGCRVLKSLPFMDRAVVSALERSRYKPYLWNGRPVEIDITFKVRLTLPQ